ncbi:MAG: ribonuclease D [Gammaproteobacteria bacterium]|nr:ribonuclease D [Gammaproteobacteria bacterium]
MKNNTDYTVISDGAALDSFCQQLQNQTWIALDTEFLREKTYYPKLCLVQIATPELAACIDPLAIDDLSPLLDLLYNRNITKVMHSGRQDLEIFYNLRGELPSPIFDTQVAAPLIGLDEQLGYASLVQELLGVNLDKSHARADWTRRPLPANQLQYAIEDVTYLAQIYPKLKSMLEERNRLQWLDSDFAAMTEPSLYQNPPETAWLRVKQANKLRPQQLSVLQALASWREITAQQQDLPRGWLCKDEVLIDICRQLPDKVQELAHIRGLTEGFVRRHGQALVELIHTAKSQPPVPLPDYERKQKLSPADFALVDALQAIVSLTAADFELHPNLLATRKMLEQFLANPSSSALEHGWRKQVLGDLLISFLRGDIMLGCHAKQLTLYDH